MKYSQVPNRRAATMNRFKIGFFASAAFVLAGGAAFSVVPGLLPSEQLSFARVSDVLGVDTSILPLGPKTKHIPTPAPLKSIYMSQCVVGTPSFRQELVDLVDTTELNAIIIDIKDFSGGIAFPTDNPLLANNVSDKCGAQDMKEFVELLHEKGIYVIGRITVFQDPMYTKQHPELSVQSKARPGQPWKDNKGLSFVAVNSEPYWDFIVELSKESYALGFDELNYDYIRWPSDGPMSDVVYPSQDTAGELEKFFRYLHEKVSPLGVVTSADLFGMTTTNTDDLNIGQVLERALPYFDYIGPMVYPSHYPKGFNGYADVNAHAYDIIHYSMSEAVRRTEATTTPVESFAHTRIGTSTPALYSKPSYSKYKMRPWLQSFDYPVTYTPEMVAAQIKANEDVGLDSYMFWDPANKYRSLRAVLKAE